MANYDFLRRVPLFSTMPIEDLSRLCEFVEEIRLPAGEMLFAEGSNGERAYVIKTGTMEILKNTNGRDVLLAIRASGEVIGEMALLQEALRTATVRARNDCVLLSIRKEDLDHLLDTSPSAARTMLQTVLARWRTTEAQLGQSEKMAQLGTLTAGVAHELNNPAAAVSRGTAQLIETLPDYEKALTALQQIEFTAEQSEQLLSMAAIVREKTEQPVLLDAVTRSDREYEMETWLDDVGAEEPWELAPLLVDLDFQQETMAELAGTFDAAHWPAVSKWLAATARVHAMVQEVNHGAGRISEIVKALKQYAYLDQAPVQQVDVHEGLENTLIIMRHKLKKGVEVRREFDPNLKPILAYGSELNQVWTNIIDNAIDAMDGEGIITLRTRQEGDWISVEIEDNGPGIPDDHQGRIFDPFFTTKPPGKGTGLGLNISYNIIVTKHFGVIKVFSVPGRTTFQIRLPVNFEAVESGEAQIMDLDQTSDEELTRILKSIETIAVVGISSQHHRPAYFVPKYMQKQGYKIYPVNPFLEEVLDEPAYPDLASVPGPVDTVLIFRPIEEVPDLVDQSIAIGARVVWMQEGIIHAEAADVARRAGLSVVMDTCIRVTHQRLLVAPQG